MATETILQSKVPPAFHGQSLLDYLSGRFAYQSRETWMALIRKGKVRVNGQKSAPQQPVHRGNVVSYSAALQEPEVDSNISILHEEETFLVASKSGNIPCHSDGQFITHTFVHALKEKKKDQGYEGFLGLAHRLDRETSGILLVAKTQDVLKVLAGAFERGEVEKQYLAWVRGLVVEETLERNDPIGRDPNSTVSIRRKALDPGAPDSLPAHTKFEVMERRGDRTLLRCLPLTGRTHQIRVHLEAAGYPVIGDKLYGRTDKEYIDFVNRSKENLPVDWTPIFGAQRQLLHAHHLGFIHPLTGKMVSYEAPIPPDMA
jgi:RluA family pseudouridine synthase